MNAEGGNQVGNPPPGWEGTPQESPTGLASVGDILRNTQYTLFKESTMALEAQKNAELVPAATQQVLQPPPLPANPKFKTITVVHHKRVTPSTGTSVTPKVENPQSGGQRKVISLLVSPVDGGNKANLESSKSELVDDKKSVEILGPRPVNLVRRLGSSGADALPFLPGSPKAPVHLTVPSAPGTVKPVLPETTVARALLTGQNHVVSGNKSVRVVTVSPKMSPVEPKAPVSKELLHKGLKSANPEYNRTLLDYVNKTLSMSGRVTMIKDGSHLRTEIQNAGDKLVVIDFFSMGSSACQRIAPQVQQLSLQYEDVTFLKVDVEHSQGAGAIYNVESTPTFVLVRDSVRLYQLQSPDIVELEEQIKAIRAQPAPKIRLVKTSPLAEPAKNKECLIWKRGRSSKPEPGPPAKQAKESTSTPVNIPLVWLSNSLFTDWLIYKKSENKIKCRYCIKHEKGPCIRTSGTSNFRVKTLKMQEKREAPLRGAGENMALETEAVPNFIDDGGDPSDNDEGDSDGDQDEISDVENAEATLERKKTSFLIGLRTVYFLAVEEIESRKYPSLLTLHQTLGGPDVSVLKGAGDNVAESTEEFFDFLTALDQVIRVDQLADIQKSPVIGVGLDVAVDRSNIDHLHLVFILRYVCGAETKTTFFKLGEIEEINAESIYGALCQMLESHGIPKNKVQCLGLDGPSVTLTDQQKLTEHMYEDNPFCVPVHSVCHRIYFAVSKAAETVSNARSLKSVISVIYQHVNDSRELHTKFADMAKLLAATDDGYGYVEEENLDMPFSAFLEYNKVFDVNWWCLNEAVQAIIRNYEPLMVALEADEDHGFPSALGLCELLRNYKLVALLHLLGDVLIVVEELSTNLLSQKFSFHSIKSQIQTAADTLNEFKVKDGPILGPFLRKTQDLKNYFMELQTFEGEGESIDQRQQFAVDREQFITAVVANIEGALPRIDLLDAMQIFDPRVYPADCLDVWGLDKLECLLGHFGVKKETQKGAYEPLVDQEVARVEFPHFKRLLASPGTEDGHSPSHGPEHYGHKIFGEDNVANRQTFKEMYKLMLLSLLVVPSSPEAERAFIVQNRVKSKLEQMKESMEEELYFKKMQEEFSLETMDDDVSVESEDGELSLDRLDKLIRLSYAGISLDAFPFNRALDNYMLKHES